MARRVWASGAVRDRGGGRWRTGRARNCAGAAGGCGVKFGAIRRRVERSEQLVDGRALQTGVRADALKSTWRESWTPARIIIAGLAAGFLAGRADPARVLKQLGSGGRWIQLVGALSGLAASLQSSIAADRSEEHTPEPQSLMPLS